MYAGQNYIVEDKENEGKRNRSSVLASNVVALQLQRARVAGRGGGKKGRGGKGGRGGTRSSRFA